MIGLIHTTDAGERSCRRLADAWERRGGGPGGPARIYAGPVRPALERAFAECSGIVCFLAAGAVVRIVAPLLRGKREDPGVVCVDEARRYAVPLLGGHEGGANALAEQVADALPGCEPVITTATDATDVPGLDMLGWRTDRDVAAVSRAILDGRLVIARADAVWPLPAYPENVVFAGPDDGRRRPAPPDLPARVRRAGDDGPEYTLRITDRAVPPTRRQAVLHPPSLVVGVGASRGASAAEIGDLIGTALAAAGLAPQSVTDLATVDAKAGEPGLLAAAGRMGVPVRAYAADVLAGVPVPNPSDAPLAAVGTPSVAEAAALAAAGPGAELVVLKRKSAGRPAMATCAVARRRPRGRLALVGLGPGARDLLTPRAREELRRASVVVGLDQYVDRIRDLLRPGTRVLASGLGAEEERARTAVAEAREGHAVALVGSGDAGVYAMASPALAEASAGVGPSGDLGIDVVGVPGVTAALAAAALLGAPLGHDHAAVSLSDLHTPWEVIERRVRAAAEGDFVVTFYNPRSRGRDRQLPRALELLAKRRDADTPVGVVRNASRRGESVRVTTIGAFDPESVDMLTVVVVGNSATRVVAGRMVTPRGYRWQA